MKRVNPELIGDVLRQTLQQQGMTERLYEAKAVAIWPMIVGEGLASQCGKPFVNAGIMTMYVRSAPLRQELNMQRSALARAINNALEREVIKDIRFK